MPYKTKTNEQWLEQAKEYHPGWWPWIKQLDEWLVERAPDYRIDQIKEKFGGLRYYITFAKDVEARDYLSDHIRFVESMTFLICEECPNPGTQTTNPRGWVKTLCPEHTKQREARL